MNRKLLRVNEKRKERSTGLTNFSGTARDPPCGEDSVFVDSTQNEFTEYFFVAVAMLIEPVTDRFFTANLGSLLFLKSCGFVEDHTAKILEVTEDTLKVRLGHTWLERLFYQCSNDRPVDVTLRIKGNDLAELSEEEKLRLPGIDCSRIDVTIVPRSRTWKESDFRQFSRKILWSLRHHFVSP